MPFVLNLELNRNSSNPQEGPYHFTRSQNVNPSVPQFVNVRFLQDRKEDDLLEKK